MFRVFTLLIASLSLIGAAVSASAQPLRLIDRAGVFAAQDGDRRERRAERQERRGERRDARAGGWRGAEERAADSVRRGQLVPLNRVIGQIQRRTPGRLLDAGLEGGERPVYRVRWAADDGRRIDFLVDAESGQFLSTE